MLVWFPCIALLLERHRSQMQQKQRVLRRRLPAWPAPPGAAAAGPSRWTVSEAAAACEIGCPADTSGTDPK